MLLALPTIKSASEGTQVPSAKPVMRAPLSSAILSEHANLAKTSHATPTTLIEELIVPSVRTSVTLDWILTR